MESKSTLVWAKCRVKLHTIASVDLEVAAVVFPDHSELDDALGYRDDAEGGLVFWVLGKEGAVFKGAYEL